MMRQGLNSVSTMVLNAQAAVYGDIAIAAMSVVSRIFNFVFSVALGIGQGLPAGILLQLWGKEVFPCKESVLVHPVRASLVTMAVLQGWCMCSAESCCWNFLRIWMPRLHFYALQIQCLTLPFIPVCICGNMLFPVHRKGRQGDDLSLLPKWHYLYPGSPDPDSLLREFFEASSGHSRCPIFCLRFCHCRWQWCS